MGESEAWSMVASTKRSVGHDVGENRSWNRCGVVNPRGQPGKTPSRRVQFDQIRRVALQLFGMARSSPARQLSGRLRSHRRRWPRAGWRVETSSSLDSAKPSERVSPGRWIGIITSAIRSDRGVELVHQGGAQ